MEAVGQNGDTQKLEDEAIGRGQGIDQSEQAQHK